MRADAKPGDSAAVHAAPVSQYQPKHKDRALLELKVVGDIAGRFFVARYQLGYRWGTLEVKHLLDDIWEM